jgi:hypothetical protein
MADLRDPSRVSLVLRGALVVGVLLGVLVLGGWFLYGSVQVFSRSFQMGPRQAPSPVSPRP